MATRKYSVHGVVKAADGGADAAYDLEGTHTVDELLALLRATLDRPVKQMLHGGISGDCGHVLTIHISDPEVYEPRGILDLAVDSLSESL